MYKTIYYLVIILNKLLKFLHLLGNCLLSHSIKVQNASYVRGNPLKMGNYKLF